MISSDRKIENSQNDLIVWDSKFAIGIEIIDQQHMFLIELCSKLNKAILEKNESEEIWRAHMLEALKSCVEYVKVHFSDEENIMKKYNYPNYKEHKSRHDEFTMKVITTSGKFPTMNRTEALRFVRFLYDWILSHVAHEDKQIAVYLQSLKNIV